MVQKILHETGLKPEFLELEITESILMKNPDESFLVFSDLKKMGVSIAIDDFGTGYSSLMQLKYLPIDILKVDKIFIDGIGQDKNDETLVSIILQMAHSLGLGVVAEGVETKEQINYLTNRDCYEMQGYYFSKPLPAKKINDIYRKESRSHPVIVCINHPEKASTPPRKPLNGSRRFQGSNSVLPPYSNSTTSKEAQKPLRNGAFVSVCIHKSFKFENH